MIIGLALEWPHAALSKRRRALAAYGLIYVGWANTAFYWFGNAAGSRALRFGDNPQGATNVLGVVGYAVAGVGSFLTLYILGMLALGFLRSDPE